MPSPSPTLEARAVTKSVLIGAHPTRDNVSQTPGPAVRSPRPSGNGVIWQASLFALVGLLNTALDFAIYNVLTSELVGWGRIPANVVSTTMAMTFSFTVNLLWVFNPERRLVPRRAWRFLLATAFALYVVQNLVIWMASDLWPAPVNTAAGFCARLLSVAGQEELMVRNLVKLAATVASMTWNYFWYRFYVFRS